MNKPRKAPARPKKGAPTRPDVKVFIREYLRDPNGRKAAIAAGYTERSADSTASRLLKNAKVRAEIDKVNAERLAKVQEETGITAAKALQRAWEIATADVNELIQYRRVCCDECWGVPLTQKERARDPNPQCDGCGGEGVGQVHAHDTRKLSPAARALYAGVKITKDGFEIKTKSQLDALEKVFKHLGLYKEDNEQSRSIAVTVVNLTDAEEQAGAWRKPSA